MKKILFGILIFLSHSLLIAQVQDTWTFETDGNAEGWTTTDGTIAVNLGRLKFTYNNNQQYLDLDYNGSGSINGKIYKTARIKIKNTSSTVTNVRWRIGTIGINPPTSLTISDTNYTDYYLDLSLSTNWHTDPISSFGIRFENPTEAYTGDILIEEIQLYELGLQEAYYFETAGDKEFWRLPANADTGASLNAVNGKLKFVMPTVSTDLQQHSKYANFSANKFVHIYYNNQSDCNKIRLSYRDVNSQTYNPTTDALMVDLEQNATGIAVFDLTLSPNITASMLYKLVVKKIDASIESYPGGTFNIDKIIINNNSHETTIWNGTSWNNGVPSSENINAIFEGNYDGTALENIEAYNITLNADVTYKKPFIHSWGDFIVSSGKTLTLESQDPNDLSALIIHKNFENNGIITGIETGRIRANGIAGTPVTFNGTGTTDIADFSIISKKSANFSGLSNAINVYKSVNIPNGDATNSTILNTSGKLVLKSNATHTAYISEMGQFSEIIGDVKVERFIPASGNRAWRLLCTPLKGSSNNAIFTNWQNNGVSNGSTGLEIWGPAGTGIGGNGLAVGPHPSMSSFSNGAWVPVTNTHTSNLFDANLPIPYLTFVSGPYGSGNILVPPGDTDNTTLVAQGEILKGDITFSGITINFHLLPNPYANALNMDAALTANTNMAQSFWVWDPIIADIGGYVSYDADSNTYSDTTGGYAASPMIQSGQAFFVKANTNTNFTVSETHKLDSSTSSVFKISNNHIDNNFDILRVNISKLSPENNWLPYDGAVCAFADGESNTWDAKDIIKFPNPAESIAFVADNQKISIEHRAIPTLDDILYLKTWNMKVADYKLILKAESFENMPFDNAYLKDILTGQVINIPLDGTVTEYVFSYENSNLAVQNRFEIYFNSNALNDDPIANVHYNLFPNPVVNQIINLQSIDFDISNLEINIINKLGQTLKYKAEILNDQTIQIYFPSPIAQGYYYIEFFDRKTQSRIVDKFIIK